MRSLGTTDDDKFLIAANVSSIAEGGHEKPYGSSAVTRMEAFQAIQVRNELTSVHCSSAYGTLKLTLMPSARYR